MDDIIRRQKSRMKKIIVILTSLFAFFSLAVFLMTDPNFYKSDVLQYLSGSSPSGSGDVYIPDNYKAKAGDIGEIEIIAGKSFTNVTGIQFKLSYNPAAVSAVDASVPSNMSSGNFFVNKNTDVSGEITVIMATGGNGVNVAQGQPLAQVSMQISSGAPLGAEISLAVSGFEIVENVSGNLRSTPYNVSAGKITLNSDGSLSLVKAYPRSGTGVVLVFSDYLTSTGAAADYTITPALSVSSVAIGSQGNTAVLTTGSQTTGTNYTVEVAGGVRGNTAGNINTNANTAYFTGYMPGGPEAFSDFSVLSVSAIDYTHINVTFNHDVNPFSVNSGVFSIIGAPQLNIVSAVRSNTSSRGIVLETSLQTSYSQYTIFIDNSDSNLTVKDTDGKILGINTAAFSAFEGSPELLQAEAASATGAVLTFSENLNPSALSNIKILQTRGSDLTVLSKTLDSSDPKKVNVIVDGNTPFNSNVNYTVSADQVKNTAGREIKNNDKYISFWGAGTVSPPTFDIVVVDSNTIKLNNFSPALKSGNTVDKTKIHISEAGTNSDIAISSARRESSDIILDITGEFDSNKSYTVYIEDTSSFLITASYNGVLDFLAEVYQPKKAKAQGAGSSPTSSYATFSGKAFLPDSVELLSGKSGSGKTVVVAFSKNLKASTVSASDFKIEVLSNGHPAGNNLAGNASVSLSTDYRKVILSGVETSANSLYIVEVIGQIKGYNGGEIDSASNSAVFQGFGTSNSSYDFKINSVQVLSGTKLKIIFSENLGAQISLNPTDFSIKTNIKGKNNLTVTNLQKLNNKEIVLTTSVQEDIPYTVVVNGTKVKNYAGILLGSKNTFVFQGFAEQDIQIISVAPKQGVNDSDTQITILGANFANGSTARLGSHNITVLSVNSNRIQAKVPSGLNPQVYDLIVLSPNGDSKTLANAFIVVQPVQRIQVKESQSRAVPDRIANDGNMSTTIWAYVLNPNGVDDIEKVTINLEPIDGLPVNVMSQGSIVGNSRWYFIADVVVPNTVATSLNPYELTVTAENKNGEKDEGKIQLTVTRNIVNSISPEVLSSAYAAPSQIPADSITPVSFYAEIKDLDGINTIDSVLLDLGPLNKGIVQMHPVISSSSAAQSTALSSGTGSALSSGTGDLQMQTVSPSINTAWFYVSNITIPPTVADGEYTLNVSATDQTGKSGTGNIKVNISEQSVAPVVESSRSYASPRSEVPNDGVTPVSLHVYITDPEGIDDVKEVTVNLRPIGNSPQRMAREFITPNSGTGVTTSHATSAKGGWFKADNVIVPTTASLGEVKLEIIASDSHGTESTGEIKLYVTNFDELGSAPRILPERAYTTPRVAVNDEKTPFSLYVFVKDNDFDINEVIVNLGNIAKVKNAELKTFAKKGEINSTCPTNSDTIVCMVPSVKEGNNGMWYVLPDIVILKDIFSSTDPYMVSVTALDNAGHTGQAQIPIKIHDGGTYTNDINPPKVVLATAVSSNAVEILFSESLDSKTIAFDGSDFVITESADIRKTLSVLNATINAEGTIVTLETETQKEGVIYAVTAGHKIKDALGISLVKGAQDKTKFIGYRKATNAPRLDYVTPTSSETVELEFHDYIKPSSIALSFNSPDGVNQTFVNLGRARSHGENFTIFSPGSPGGEYLNIKSVSFGKDSRIIILKTEPQEAEKRYAVKVRKISNYNGKYTKKSGITRFFKGYKNIIKGQKELKIRADFNGDGKVDFSDFTMFSAVYGEGYNINGKENIYNPSGIGSMPQAGLSDNQVLRPESSGPYPLPSIMPSSTPPTVPVNNAEQISSAEDNSNVLHNSAATGESPSDGGGIQTVSASGQTIFGETVPSSGSGGVPVSIFDSF